MCAMFSCLYSTNYDWIVWKIYECACQSKKLVYFFDKKSTISEISEKFFDQTIFDYNAKQFDDQWIYVIDITSWQLKSKPIKTFFENLIKSKKNIFLISTLTYMSNLIFNQLGINISRVYKPLYASKVKMIDFCLKKNQIDFDVKENHDYLYEHLPTNYFFINSEIKKLSLLSKTNKIDTKILKQVIMILFEENIFSIIYLWLNNQASKCINQIKQLVYYGNQITTIMHVFATQLFQVKMFLLALKDRKWDTKKILEKLGLSVYQQKQFMVFQSKINILDKIEKNLIKLYQLDVDIKLKKILAFPAFVQILLNN